VLNSERAVAVEAEIGGSVQHIAAGEIVLSAGAVMSAHLLMMSGVGPAAVLRRCGLQPLVDLPGVGSQCRDHPQLFVQLHADDLLQPSRDVVQVGLDADVHGAPVALMPYLQSMSELVPGSGAPPQERVIGMLLERSSAGVEVRPVSADPTVAPFIDHHSLEHHEDRERLRHLAELGATIADSPSIRALGLRRVGPPMDADLDAWISGNVSTAVHLCSSAPMGPDSDPLAVVDQRCRVRGVDGLRVVDTSVLPSAPSRGPACTAVLIGERAAEFF
jgi:choline dehydrogenase-like flavoprotein